MAIDEAIGEAGKEFGKEAGKSGAAVLGAIKERAIDLLADRALADGSAFADFLSQASNSLSEVKTILYRQPRPLDSFYEPARIQISGDMMPGIARLLRRVPDEDFFGILPSG